MAEGASCFRECIGSLCFSYLPGPSRFSVFFRLQIAGNVGAGLQKPKTEVVEDAPNRANMAYMS